MKWGKTRTQTKGAHTRNTNTDTHKEKTGHKKTNISEFKTNRAHAHSHSHTNTRAKMMDCKAPVAIYLCLYLPIQLACSALTLPERLDLMTCWERDRDTGEGGRLRERRRKKMKGGKKRERGQMRGDREKVKRKKKE